ncbi:hypothetical protein VB713_00415 [Anabaena cylindrica UHCC 0172]|uniref:hypothetical protein n=1 Tax=Anabaena cylindrica TaxID=1165 RepID=UPI002B20238B|nr:hypothetical protein [Anabaena cylindrica]MEA5549455.1 hypothetical protein [Anabaena cylindrica UHCC 0172]
MDALLITVINAAACLALPKFLSMLLAPQVKPPQPSLIESRLHTPRIETTSFPYCTVYALTGSQFCKFSPRFCSQCSPNGGEW